MLSNKRENRELVYPWEAVSECFCITCLVFFPCLPLLIVQMWICRFVCASVKKKETNWQSRAQLNNLLLLAVLFHYYLQQRGKCLWRLILNSENDTLIYLTNFGLLKVQSWLTPYWLKSGPFSIYFQIFPPSLSKCYLLYLKIRHILVMSVFFQWDQFRAKCNSFSGWELGKQIREEYL